MYPNENRYTLEISFQDLSSLVKSSSRDENIQEKTVLCLIFLLTGSFEYG